MKSLVVTLILRAGSFRVFRGIDEIHEVENTSDVPSEFLRVEFKTEPTDASTLRGRFHREAVAPGETVENVQFENGQIRITRVTCSAARGLALTAGATEPMLLFELAPAAGKEPWVPAGHTETLQNHGAALHELLRFDFKTAPLR